MGMRSCDSRCLFSGSKGEVCAIEPLLAPPDFRDHPITHYSLLAMASLTKVPKQTVCCSDSALPVFSRPTYCTSVRVCKVFAFRFIFNRFWSLDWSPHSKCGWLSPIARFVFVDLFILLVSTFWYVSIIDLNLYLVPLQMNTVFRLKKKHCLQK